MIKLIKFVISSGPFAVTHSILHRLNVIILRCHTLDLCYMSIDVYVCCECHSVKYHKKPIYFHAPQPAIDFRVHFDKLCVRLASFSNGMLWLLFIFLSFSPSNSLFPPIHSFDLLCVLRSNFECIQINARCDWCYFIMNNNYGTLINRLHWEKKNLSLIFLAFSPSIMISTGFILPWAWLNWILYFDFYSIPM